MSRHLGIGYNVHRPDALALLFFIGFQVKLIITIFRSFFLIIGFS